VGTLTYGNSTPINVNLTSVSAVGRAGLVTYAATFPVNVTLTSVTTSGLLGALKFNRTVGITFNRANAFVSNAIYTIVPVLTSARANGVVSSIASYAVSFGLTGTYASGYAGTVVNTSWRNIDDSQSASWVPINNTQSPTWTVIDTPQVPGWTGINI
jgi:hypothetical protein